MFDHSKYFLRALDIDRNLLPERFGGSKFHFVSQAVQENQTSLPSASGDYFV